MPKELRFPCASGVLVLALHACASSGADVHLAPFYTRASTADGGTLVEAAGGLYRQHRRDEDGFLEWLTLAPLYGIERRRDGDMAADHPFLLGRTRARAGERVSYTVPLYLGWDKEQADGTNRGLLLTLPGFLLQDEYGEKKFGWFPFYGRFENVLTFDLATFTLWPFYVHAVRAKRESYHVLWPFFGWTTGGGESSWHVFPLYARARIEDRYDRTYVLWPIFHWQESHLGGGGEEPERAWMVFPLVGHETRGTFDAYTALWPFLGYSRDPRSGFWALDFPFPLVRLQRGPDDTVRTRFWPLYSNFESNGLTSKSWLWPLLHLRHEENAVFERDAVYIVPFWQTWDRVDKLSGETAAWRKVWPLFRYHRAGERREGALLDLDPFFRNAAMARYLTGFFHLYEWEDEPAFRRERSFLGLYRRERGRGEDRRSLAGLWSSRRYTDEDGPVRETSLLFGLLRWRSSAQGGLDLLRPAFPGPGWSKPEEVGPARESLSYF